MDFIEKLKVVFKDNNIEIMDFKGEKSEITYKCLDCGEIYNFKCSRNLLSKITLCKKCYNPFDRWNKERIENFKIKRLYPNSDISIIEFKGYRSGGKVICNKCGTIEEINNFEAVFNCRKDKFCNECEKDKDKIKKHLEKELEKGFVHLIEWKGANNKSIFKCNRCGHIFEKKVSKNFNGQLCPNCFKAHNTFTFLDAQEQLNKKGNNEYTLLQYKGEKQRSLIKHKCGFCFSTRLVDFQKTRGCPKCYRKISSYEQKVMNFLKEENINYEYQKRFSNLPRQSFDFCIYLNGKMILLEVQGEQHYKEIEIFDDFKSQQKRDSRKREYCLINNVPLIEIPYWEIPNLKQFLQLKLKDYLKRE